MQVWGNEVKNEVKNGVKKWGQKWGQVYFIICKPGLTLSNPRRDYNYRGLSLKHFRIHAMS